MNSYRHWRELRKRAAVGYNALTDAQYALWEDYAQAQTAVNPVTGIPRTPQVYMLYVTLAAKLLQAVPNAPLPTVPPAQGFVGDGIGLTISGGQDEITFAASGANSANVITELLVQSLASRHRKPLPRAYRPQAFVPFTAAHLAQTVAAESGWYACAIRFVHIETGQASGLIEIGKVLVG